eukprot:6501844-Pyramimonas_sp.AAC.1
MARPRVRRLPRPSARRASFRSRPSATGEALFERTSLRPSMMGIGAPETALGHPRVLPVSGARAHVSRACVRKCGSNVAQG